MSSLTAIFGSSEEKTHDSDKLMELYWNRAELKKEFAAMRKERYQLQDRIKEKEGAIARIQQRLDHLENLLVDPAWAHNVVVFYQLRGLGRRCERKLARFAEQLKQQREKKKHNALLVNWNEQRKQEAREIEEQVVQKRDLMQQLEDQLQSEQRRLTSMSGFKRWFRGRSAMKGIDALAAQVEATAHEEEGLRMNLEEVRNRKPPDHEGLDIAAKRSINLMILAFAQQLYLHFDEFGIAAQLKEATEKSVGAINYGTRYECDQLLQKMHKSMDRLDKVAEPADILKQRAVKLGEDARFASSKDAVPVADTMSTLYKIDGDGTVHRSELNVAGENYWGISRIFSR